MTKIIGLTGGIGSGKTTIARHIESLGIPVYISDLEAKKIMGNSAVISKVFQAFGNEIVENGIINKENLANLVFNNPEKLKILNEIIHPEVRDHFKNWVKKNQDFPLVIKEAAILFESGSYKDCDKIILVIAPKLIRIQRVMERDKVSQEVVESRMKNQWDDEEKKLLSDYIIENVDINLANSNAEKIISSLRNQ